MDAANIAHIDCSEMLMLPPLSLMSGVVKPERGDNESEHKLLQLEYRLAESERKVMELERKLARWDRRLVELEHKLSESERKPAAPQFESAKPDYKPAHPPAENERESAKSKHVLTEVDPKPSSSEGNWASSEPKVTESLSTVGGAECEHMSPGSCQGISSKIQSALVEREVMQKKCERERSTSEKWLLEQACSINRREQDVSIREIEMLSKRIAAAEGQVELKKTREALSDCCELLQAMEMLMRENLDIATTIIESAPVSYKDIRNYVCDLQAYTSTEVTGLTTRKHNVKSGKEVVEILTQKIGRVHRGLNEVTMELTKHQESVSAISTMFYALLDRIHEKTRVNQSHIKGDNHDLTPNKSHVNSEMNDIPDKRHKVINIDTVRKAKKLEGRCRQAA